jgi:hypothetical protein
MDATLILIDSDAELSRARALVDQLWDSENPSDIARLQAQARLIAAAAPPEHGAADHAAVVVEIAWRISTHEGMTTGDASLPRSVYPLT